MFNIEFERNFDIKIIINKRFRIFNKIIVTQYLIRWKDWDSIFDEWKNIAKLIDFIDLIEKYERQHFDNAELHQFFDESTRRSKKSFVIKNLLKVKKSTAIQLSKSIIKSTKNRRRLDKKNIITSLFIVVTSIIFVVTKSILTKSIAIVTRFNKQFRSRKSHVSRSSIDTSSSPNNFYYQTDNYVGSKMNVKNRS